MLKTKCLLATYFSHKQMKKIDLKIVFFGDSITEGQYMNTTHRWTNLISNGLKKEIFHTPVNFIIRNCGISGQTTREALLRFPKDVQVEHPDVLVVQFGLNDCNCWATDQGLPRVSEFSFEANLSEMVNRARHFGIKHIILSTNHKTLRNNVLPNGGTLEKQRLHYNSLIRKTAQTVNVTLCDIALEFDKIKDKDLQEYLLPDPDLLHLSQKGHQYYAESIKPYIDKEIQTILSHFHKGMSHVGTHKSQNFYR